MNRGGPGRLKRLTGLNFMGFPCCFQQGFPCVYPEPGADCTMGWRSLPLFAGLNDMARYESFGVIAVHEANVRQLMAMTKIGFFMPTLYILVYRSRRATGITVSACL